MCEVWNQIKIKSFIIAFFVTLTRGSVSTVTYACLLLESCRFFFFYFFDLHDRLWVCCLVFLCVGHLDIVVISYILNGIFAVKVVCDMQWRVVKNLFCIKVYKKHLNLLISILIVTSKHIVYGDFFVNEMIVHYVVLCSWQLWIPTRVLRQCSTLSLDGGSTN